MTVINHAISYLLLYIFTTFAFTLTQRLSQPPNHEISQPDPLASLASLNSPTVSSILPSLGRTPPRRFDYIYEMYNVSMYRNPSTSHSRSILDPGISPHNWAIALQNASTALQTAYQTAGLDQDDAIPFGKWNFMVPVDRVATRTVHRPRRQVAFNFRAREVPSKLTYREVSIVLNGLRMFGKEWDGGNSRDLVRMCKVELRITDDDDGDILVASGASSILDPPSESSGDGDAAEF